MFIHIYIVITSKINLAIVKDMCFSWVIEKINNNICSKQKYNVNWNYISKVIKTPFNWQKIINNQPIFNQLSFKLFLSIKFLFFCFFLFLYMELINIKKYESNNQLKIGSALSRLNLNDAFKNVINFLN